MTLPAPRLRLHEATVTYPGRRAASLSDVALTVTAGERVGATGRTGAGTSTLALLAGGLIPRVVRARVDGTATVDGMSLTDPDPGALLGSVGIVFATPANQLSASKRTVREELAFGLENLGMPRAEMDPRIDDVLDRLGIGHLAEREPLSLSGGEQQRVAVASIVAMGTRLLVLDQPTAQLDPSGTAEVAALLDSLAAGGTAIVCVEHDPVILARMDRVVVLDGGRVAGTDRPGVALGRRVAGAVGLPAPTLIALAEIAGVDPAHALENAIVAHGLATAAAAGRLREVTADGDLHGAIDWAPLPGRREARVRIDALVHRYPDGVEAVRDVSLAVEPGESVAIVGGNGSGKTTLVKHLVGLLRPTSGGILLDGRATSDQPIADLARTVGFVFQDPSAQLFERTVEREVSFGPRNLGMAAARVGELVDSSLDAVGMTDERSTNPYDLDLAHRKLVALAAVLAMDPAIVVLDEPTTGADPLGVRRIAAIVHALRAAGRTVVAVTHDMELAATAFERVVVMRSGEVIADGPPTSVLAAPAAGLLATTGLTPPPAALIGARIGLPPEAVTASSVLAALASSARG